MIQGALTDVNSTDKSVTVTHCDGSTSVIKFKYLVLCTGSTLTQFKDCSSAEIINFIKEFALTIASKNNIAVVGAGAVGVEFASELKDRFPDKSITLIGQSLIPNPKLPQSKID